MLNGNTLDMLVAQLYRKGEDNLVFLLPVSVDIIKSWGIQNMTSGSVLIVNPGSGDPESGVIAEVYGCDWEAFCDTYEPVRDKPGWFRKKTLIRAMQMTEPFTVTTLDNPEPYTGNVGDWLVENIRPDGSPLDRYFIKDEKFRRMYVLA